MEMPQNESQQKSKKFIPKISDEAERKRGEKVLDEAIENTFPASDPVSAEQPVHAHHFQNPSTADAEPGDTAEWIAARNFENVLEYPPYGYSAYRSVLELLGGQQSDPAKEEVFWSMIP